jgi:lysyl-tRNA synthetase, class II
MTTAIAECNRRRTKTDRLRAEGIDPFPHFASPARDLISKIQQPTDPAQDELDHGHTYHLAGRVIARRKRGSTVLLELRDRTGVIRLRVRPGAISPLDCLWDIGDIIAVTGQRCDLHNGEVGLDVSSGALLAKALQINHGLSQPDHQTRRPELVLMESEEHRERFIARARVIAAIRAWMRERQFVEVETPTLQAPLSGAVARPFHTHHNALDREASLRISSELYLRRCTVGDMERVFELGRCFRNEGMSARHSPEFTMLEWSMAYSNYLDAASLIESLVRHLAATVLKAPEVTYRDARINFDAPWRRISLRDAIKEHTGSDILDARAMRSADGRLCQPGDKSWSDAVRRLYAAEVEPRLIQPSIVYDFPLETHPCAKRHSRIPRLAECFDVVVGGLEIASGGTEGNDPDEQRWRFAHQHDASSDTGDLSHGDRGYIKALEYGAPPSSGAGVGVDRLLMALLGVEDIADVSLFPPLG